jgi:putative glutamine amidotransferase
LVLSVSDVATYRPVIGLSTYVEPARWGRSEEPAALLPHSYVTAVIRVDAYPVLLPPCPRDPGQVLDVLDGLVITGGPDLDPDLYAAARHPMTGPPRPDRDAWELALAERALAVGLPLLAICRGVQVLNVALGGTLHQHLPDVVGHQGHRPAVGQMGTTAVSLQPGSTFSEILGQTTSVLCHHHQAIDRIGRGLLPVGYASDGTIEAVECTEHPFGLGIQWHPEDNPRDDRLFDALAEAAAHHRVGRVH